jgi:hypothetical protein
MLVRGQDRYRHDPPAQAGGRQGRHGLRVLVLIADV